MKRKMGVGNGGVNVVIPNSATVLCIINKHSKKYITTPSTMESLQAIHFPNEFVCHKMYEIVNNQMLQLIVALMFLSILDTDYFHI